MRCKVCDKMFEPDVWHPSTETCSPRCSSRLSFLNRKEKIYKYQAEYRKKNKKKLHQYWKEYRKKNKERVKKWSVKVREEYYQYYLRLKKDRGGKCERCGWDKKFEVLQWHHTDPSEKEFTISSLGRTPGYRYKVEKEIKKCELLCPNCHTVTHFKNGGYQNATTRRNTSSA